MPASRIGTRILGNDRPGPISMRLKDTYWRKHEEGWHRTPVRPLEADALVVPAHAGTHTCLLYTSPSPRDS